MTAPSTSAGGVVVAEAVLECKPRTFTPIDFKKPGRRLAGKRNQQQRQQQSKTAHFFIWINSKQPQR
jgi:hypothetical protein